MKDGVAKKMQNLTSESRLFHSFVENSQEPTVFVLRLLLILLMKNAEINRINK